MIYATCLSINKYASCRNLVAYIFKLFFDIIKGIPI
jgi:hypothetical protein